MPRTAILETQLDNRKVRRGKVRDVYDLGDALLIVASDRISAFDWVMPNGIPDKGRVLTQLSLFWFELLDVPNHFVTDDLAKMDLPFNTAGQGLEGRSMLVRKAAVVPIECVVRGYLSGSGWKEYQKGKTVCGIRLPDGLTESAKLPEPIFTPATKAETGHDENISFAQMADAVGRETAEELQRRSIEVYRRGAEYAAARGIILADTKFEWGRFDGELILIDEVLTPDSSRFWPADQYQPGRGQPSYDKQFVRDWLETTGWDKNSTPPALSPDVVERTRSKYIEAYERITGREFAWK
jgi:phosphoribosylaminoimidazole-succinocarboxamide synthase